MLGCRAVAEAASEGQKTIMCSAVSRIEIDFQLPVELTDKEMQWLDKFTRQICDRHQPEGWVYWPSGYGSRPNFSQVDSMFLGKPVDPDAPVSGEPTFDHSVYCISTCAREAWPEEIERDRLRAEAAARKKHSLRYRAFTAAYKPLNWIGDLLYRMENRRWAKK